MLKCESRFSLHAVQCKWQRGSVLMICSYYFKNGYPRHFVPMFCGTAILTLFLACSWFFSKIKAFVLIKLKKKKVSSHTLWGPGHELIKAYIFTNLDLLSLKALRNQIHIKKNIGVK